MRHYTVLYKRPILFISTGNPGCLFVEMLRYSKLMSKVENKFIVTDIAYAAIVR